jgi:hypothetical protein
MTVPTLTSSDSLLAQAFWEALDEPAPMRDFVVTVQPVGCIAPMVTLVKARHAFDAWKPWARHRKAPPSMSGR